MKWNILLSTLLSGCAFASPIPEVEERSLVAKRQYSGASTQNQLKDGTPCRAVTIIFARGTTESGNVGTLAGPPFFQALVNLIGADKVAVQGVDYPADVNGYNAGGDAAGSDTMAQLAAQAQSQCPQTNLVLSGYSQGGQLVHNAAGKFSASLTSFVSSVVIFGDPLRNRPVGAVPSSKVLIICHSGDLICAGFPFILPDHLNYNNDAGTAAQFVANRATL